MSQSSSLILNCILFISCQFSVFIRPYNNTEKKKDNPSTSNLQKFKRTICRKCKKFYFTILTSKPLSFNSELQQVGNVYEPHIRHSSLFSREHTMAAVLRSLISCSEDVAGCASFSFSLFRVNWMGLAAGLVLR